MSAIDLSDTIMAKSDQLNAADLANPLTITITKASKKKSDSDQPVSIFFEGDEGKPWKPCKSMRRVIAKLWGSKVDMTGRQITLVCDPDVTWGGQEVGGIRISHMSHIDKKKTIPLRVSRHKVSKYVVDPILSQPEDPRLPQLRSDGQEAAESGVEAYKDWLDILEVDEKPLIKKYHAGWSKIAKSVVVEEEDLDLDIPEDDEEMPI